MDRKTADELQEHMVGTYDGLRRGLAAIGAALPILVLLVGGVLHGEWCKGSISAYYHTGSSLGIFTTRDLFVGSLLAVGTCLYLYRGFSTRENVALNLAGVFAAFVALLPTAAPGRATDTVTILHRTAAVLFFICIAYVSIFRSRDTLYLLSERRRSHYSRRYLWTGLAMVLSPLAALVVQFVIDRGSNSAPDSEYGVFVFWLEALAVWAFAWYWAVKTREMRESRAERRALEAELKRDVVPTTPADAAQIGGASGAILKVLSPTSAREERIVPANSPVTP